jgi:hypothetical protein
VNSDQAIFISPLSLCPGLIAMAVQACWERNQLKSALVQLQAVW